MTGACMAAEHLIRGGHRRIGMICAKPGSRKQERHMQGYREALEEARLPFDPRLVVTGRTE